MSCVSAVDNQTDDAVAIETDIQTDEILTDENDGTFKQLQDLINNEADNELKLEKNYTYNEDIEPAHSPVGIDKPDNFVIDGQGHTIDAKGKVSIFEVMSTNVTLKNIIFKNGYTAGQYAAGVFFKFSGTIENCTFIDFVTSGITSAVNFNDNGIIKDSTFIGNNATYGSAVRFYKSGIVDNCNFTNNNQQAPTIRFDEDGLVNNTILNKNKGHIEFYGGGIVENSNFTENIGGTTSSVVFNNAGRIYNSNFINNSASYSAVKATSEFTLESSNFIGNRASVYQAGAVYTSGVAYINNCNFTNNRAQLSGGALYSINNITISKSTFKNNTAPNAAAIYSDSGHDGDALAIITDSNFFNNTAKDNGTVYFNKNGTVINSNFIGNKAGVGGAIYANANLKVLNSVFLKNKANSKNLIGVVQLSPLVVEFSGEHNYINAIYSIQTPYFSNVTFWNGKNANTDSETILNKASGITIAFECRDHYSVELIRNVTVMTNESAMAYYDLYQLPDGAYEINVYHPDDEYYTYAAIQSLYPWVNNRNSSLVVITTFEDELVYGNAKIAFMVINRTNVSVVVTKNGVVVYNETTNEDSVTLDLAAGEEYNITVYNAHNKYYSASQDSKVFKIIKANSAIKLEQIEDVTFYDSFLIIWSGENLTDLYQLEIYNDTETLFNQSLQDAFYLATAEYDAGKYYIRVTNLENENYTASNDTISFNVLKANSTITVEPLDDIIYGDNFTVKWDGVNLTGKYPVKIYTDEGIISLPFVDETSFEVTTLLAPGKYYITVTNQGNKNYNPSNDTISFNILKVIINVTDVKYGLNNSYEYKAVLHLENGTGVVNKTLTFTLNNVTYNATTDENGTAKITLNSLDVGSYDIEISYFDVNTTPKITVLPRIVDNSNLVMDYDSNSFTVTALGDDGNPIANETVKMVVNGKTYNVKTNKDGIATLPIELKPKTYTITSTYKGTTVKNTIKVKSTLKAVKKTVKVKKTAKKLVLKATLKWSNGKAIIGKKITFKFKGKKYTVKTNKKGLAKLKIKKKVIKKLKKAKTYKAKISYKNETVKTKVKVKK